MTDRLDRPCDFRALISVWLLLLASGCSDRPVSADAVPVATQSDSAGVSVVTITGTISKLPTWQLTTPLIEVLGDSAPFIGSVGEVAILSDGRLLIEDDQSAELYIMAEDGASLRRLAGAGSGPGEFQDVTTLTVSAADTVFAYDRALNRISVFAPGGVFVTSVSVDHQIGEDRARAVAAWAFDSDHFLLQRESPLDAPESPGENWRAQRDALLFLLDGSGRTDGAPLRFQGGYQIRTPQTIIVAPFANVPIVAVGPNRVVRGSGLKYELFVHSPALDLLRVIRWPGGRPLVTDSVLTRARLAAEEIFEDVRQSNPEAVETIIAAMFSSDFLPDTLPALGSAIIDDQNRIWVSQFRPATDPWAQSHAWHVLGPEGAPLARVMLPPQARLAAVRGDRIVLVEFNELDVQHVRAYELLKGEAP